MTNEPRIEISLNRPNRVYDPRDELVATFQVEGISNDLIEAVELSIIWVTEGTGEEDLGTHDFLRLAKSEREKIDFSEQRTFRTNLPLSPLSYRGKILKIRWAVRIRLFVADDAQEFVEETDFQLGTSLPMAARNDDAA